jgi:ATP-dependent Lhr-like helicase
MELGLDVGDLDLVMQLGAPSTVSAFLQRLGRTGRRADAKGHFVFLTDEEWQFVQACALVSLASRGQVEEIEPSRRAAHVFVQQVLARVLAESGVSRARLVAGVGEPYCFSGLSADDRAQLVDHLVAGDILTSVSGLLTFGSTGERAFSAANFRDLYAVFDSPQQLIVRTTGNREIGTLDAWFAQSFRDKDFVFVLGGRAWQATEWDWDKGVVIVKEAQRGKVPSWSGTPRLLSRMIAEEMRRRLIDETPLPFLGKQAQTLLNHLSAEWRPVLSPARLVIARHGDFVYLYTFAGGRINNVLGKVYEMQTRRSCSIDNLRVRVNVPESGPFDGPLRQVLETTRQADRLVELGPTLTADLSRGRLSKFQPYLPSSYETELLVDRLLDLKGAAALASSSCTTCSH